MTLDSDLTEIRAVKGAMQVAREACNFEITLDIKPKTLKLTVIPPNNPSTNKEWQVYPRNDYNEAITYLHGMTFGCKNLKK
jgi:hypothetical protein